MQKGTRWRILEEVHRAGQASVAELVASTGVNPTTVHHHLATLEREGLIRTEERRHGQGRPRLVCFLTEPGQTLFPQGYRWLAEEILQAITTQDGPTTVNLIFEQVGERLAGRYLLRLKGKDTDNRLREIEKILTEMGFDTTVQRAAPGVRLCNRNCPVLAIAQRYPQLCAMEQRLISMLLGRETPRTEHRLAGAPVCTYVAASRN